MVDNKPCIHAKKIEFTESFQVTVVQYHQGLPEPQTEGADHGQAGRKINVQEQYNNVAQGIPIIPMNTMSSAKANVVEDG